MMRPLPAFDLSDKGGDPERFKAISKAYDILGDPDKRQKYDAGFGEEGADRGDGPGMGGGGSAK